MRFTFRFDATKRQVYSETLDPARAKFHLSASLWRRVLLDGAAFVPLILLAVYFENYVIGAMAAVFGVFVVLWQIAAFGYSRDRNLEKELAATNFYSKKVLIFVGCFWLVLIGVICVILYLRFPR
jgi:hypothetical protein